MHSSLADRQLSAAPARGLLSLYLELTKARLTALVVLTTIAGFAVAPTFAFDWAALLWTVVGTSLAAGCANALNQVVEAHRDALMERTRSRPVPSGALGVRHAFVAAIVMGYAGIAILGMFVNLLTAGLALLTILLYVLVYTPLKPRSTTNTLVGAVCGAIPPVMGWTGATGSIDARVLILGAILFVWQLPHFFALAWLYREDYARGGYRMLPVVDTEGHLTARVMLVSSLMLLPVALLATMVGIAGWVFAAGAILLGGWMVGLSLRMLRMRSDANARSVFLASLGYLPLLLCLMVIDRAPTTSWSVEDVVTLVAAGGPTP